MKKLILSLCLSAVLFGMADNVSAIKLPIIPHNTLLGEQSVLITPQKKKVIQDIIPQIIVTSSSSTEPVFASSTVVAELEVKVSEQAKQIEELKAMLLKLISELQRQINELLKKV